VEVVIAFNGCWVFTPQELLWLTPDIDVNIFLPGILGRNLIPVQTLLRDENRCTEVTCVLRAERMGWKLQGNVNKRGFVSIVVAVCGNSACQHSITAKKPLNITCSSSG